MKCNCESLHCLPEHRPAECRETAYVRCLYVGGVCLACAVILKDYLVPWDGE